MPRGIAGLPGSAATIIGHMKHMLRCARSDGARSSRRCRPRRRQAPVKIDGTGGARTAKQTRPPDNRRPRGTAVGLLGWRAGIRSDAFGAIPFLDAAATDRRGGRRVRRSRQHEPRLQDRRRRDRDVKSAAHRSRSARSGVPHRRDSGRRRVSPASCWISRRRSRSNLILTQTAGESRRCQGRGRRRRAACTSRATTTLGANLRDAAKAAPLLLELSKQQPPEAPEWPNKCTDCATSRPSTRPLFFTIVPGAAENYDKAVRVAQGYRVNAISRMLPITTAGSHSGRREEQKIDAAVPRQALVEAEAGEKAAHHRRVSGRRFLSQHRCAREPDAAAHREVHRRVRAGLRQQPREPEISAHQAVRRRISQQRRRSGVLGSRSARRPDPLCQRRRRRGRAARDHVRVAGSCASSAS